ncbi:zinc finger protein 277-like [Saccoglossus kowalevskii]|uniref:Zinc finger protein 277-like n=1 Tax=Saccoglossus kowalevskii TaxID=10224 RepID=A0ABM0H1I3_SACKO|nr:PREDICTED: zinc finger protein 277-like [Saccoglossus kowalevskii]
MAEGGDSVSGDQKQKNYNAVLEPLSFSECASSSSCIPENSTTACLVCNHPYDMVKEKDIFLKHLAVDHKLIIGDVNLICDLKSYVEYWWKRFREKPITEFCYVLITNSRPIDKGPKENYYFLSPKLPEDNELRENLQRKRLNWILESQQKERIDQSFSRGCFFCRQHFDGNRAEFLNHMARDHGFSIGKPDNVVFVNEFLDILEEKMDSFQCLFCEKTFKDRSVLKDHMRKKQHKRINPKNTMYDKYYIINYLELGKNWEEVQAEDDTDLPAPATQSDNDDHWEDWEEKSGASAFCLFCDYSSTDIDKLLGHMSESHDFDLTQIKEEQGLNFYQQVKLLNYIRRQVHQNVCLSCQRKFDDKATMVEHLKKENHVKQLPPADTWDQPQYYFPTYENDALLCLLTDEDTELSGQVVVPEDAPHIDSSILQQLDVKTLLK